MPENLDAAFSLLKLQCEGALGTLEGECPFVSAVGYLYEKSTGPEDLGKIYFLLSDLARHTKNLRVNSQASLLVVEDDEAPIHEKKRLSLQGKVVLTNGKLEKLKSEYFKVFPKSGIFFTLADFHFYEMAISEIHWIGGFGKVATFR